MRSSTNYNLQLRYECLGMQDGKFQVFQLQLIPRLHDEASSTSQLVDLASSCKRGITQSASNDCCHFLMYSEKCYCICVTNANLRFYPRDAMLARSLRQRRVCLSVCPDVRHTPVLCLAERKQDHEMYTV